MSQKVSAQVIAELGLNAATLDRIHTVAFPQLVAASVKVLRQGAATSGVPDLRRIADIPGFEPVVDGKILPSHPFDPQASPYGADVPMIIGSTLNEFVHAIDHPEYEQMTAVEAEQRVRGLFGDKAATVLATYRRRTAQARPFDLWSRIAASTVRASAIKQARMHSAAGRARAYLYWFTWQTPILSGRPRAFHCAELPFVFDNTDRCETMTGGGPEARSLAAKMSDAWIRFARTGDPNHAQLPHWSPVTDEKLTTMIFDRNCEALVAPDAEEQASIAG
jgi:para-nitrobenzyl esterase